MTEAPAPVTLFGEGQEPLPRLAGAGTRVKGRRPLIRRDSPAQLPLMMPVRQAPAESDPLDELPPVQPLAGQLSLEANQLEISDYGPEPMQLSLLDDPQPWESSEPARGSARTGRLARRRARKGIAPGQMPLF